ISSMMRTLSSLSSTTRTNGFTLEPSRALLPRRRAISCLTVPRIARGTGQYIGRPARVLEASARIADADERGGARKGQEAVGLGDRCLVAAHGHGAGDGERVPGGRTEPDGARDVERGAGRHPDATDRHQHARECERAADVDHAVDVEQSRAPLWRADDEVARN